MGKIDLKEAYYTVSVRKRDRKYLGFSFNDILYEFVRLPYGLSIAPYVFTKLLKPVFAFLTSKGIHCVVYLDDILILASTIEVCKKEIIYTCQLVQKLGFIIYIEKSLLEPDTTCQYLGYVLVQ